MDREMDGERITFFLGFFCMAWWQWQLRIIAGVTRRSWLSAALCRFMVVMAATLSLAVLRARKTHGPPAASICALGHELEILCKKPLTLQRMCLGFSLQTV